MTILLKPEEAADELRLSRSKVYELLATGRLGSVVIGRSRRVTREALDEYVHTLIAEQHAPIPGDSGWQQARSRSSGITRALESKSAVESTGE